MQNSKKMIAGYPVGGLLVLVIVPSIIYFITSLVDTICRIEIVPDATLRWIIIPLLLAVGLVYAIWSLIIQNIVGKGGPMEIGNIEISPKTKYLVVSGPYQNTRNPMLFGASLMYLAFALYINSLTSLVLVVALIVFMLTVVVKMEEKRLLKDFGSQYEEYRKKVPVFFPWFPRKK